jgi:predicted oxidoreductase
MPHNPPPPERVRLTKTGPELSRLVWGSMRCIEQFASTAELAKFLGFLLDRGVTSLDTADIYGNYRVEDFLGDALRQYGKGRDRFEIVTKADIAIPTAGSGNRVLHFNATGAHIRRQAETSLKKLGVEALDVLLVHRPDHLMDADDTAATLEALCAEGKVKHIGVSNFQPRHWRLLTSRLKTPLVTNQVQLSPIYLDTLSDGSLDLAQELRIRPMIWSPLGGGQLMKDASERTIKVRAALDSVAKRTGLAGPIEAAIAWVARHPTRPLPVVGTGRREGIDGALRALAAQLDHQDWYEIVLASDASLVP